MLRVDEGKKAEGNECPKEHRETEGGNECPKEHKEAEGGNECPKKNREAEGGNECPKKHREAEERNECPKQHKQAEEGKVGMTEAEGKNIQHEPKRRKDSTVRPRRKKVLRRTTDIAERCR